MSHIGRSPRAVGPAWTTRGAAPGRVGVLLVNLGTPEGTGYWTVRRYLSEFLSDRRVIDFPPAVWQPLLQGVILTTRPFRTAAAYRAIWRAQTDESPLRYFTRRQAEDVREHLPEARTVVVDWAMRYGTPSIDARLRALTDAGCDRILILPLYPQYSAATTATVNDAAFRSLMRLRRQPATRTAASFPDHPLYVRALADGVRASLGALAWEPELLIGSFHGLPRRYVQAGDPYATECGRTMVALRRALHASPRAFPVTFQSRFGPGRWLEPSTSGRLTALARRGVRRVAVVAPGFMADCVETLEELDQALRATFRDAGGTHFHLVPCLNDGPGTTALLDAIIRRELAGWIGEAWS